eukprot:CAMPEP_0202850910 /NCGR_PEP_ID=MMETSP1389-20130828/84880_1 /ASSEMBLY_ACC=CAM_ASM_000865 /TAXON_ID=302021 /ORGANISM="Rhodomonas sp., Strain CCMP768" /LENGTH=37 /DNA_ID= /DNA_START= /DNA_END= /DNA_ORIENTATION=
MGSPLREPHLEVFSLRAMQTRSQQRGFRAEDRAMRVL